LSNAKSVLHLVAGNAFQIVCALALGTIALGLILESWWWPADAIAQLRLHNTVVLLVLGIGLAVSRRWKWATVAAAGIGISLIFSLPGLIKTAPTGEAADGKVLRILSHNLNFQNEQFDVAIDAIEAADADVVILFEITLAWQQALQRLESIYDFHLVEAEQGQFGIAIFSREEFQYDPEPFSAKGIHPVIAKFKNGSKPFTVIGVHPPPAIGGELFEIRNRFLDLLAINVQFRNEPVVVAGDFNITPVSRAYRKLLRETELRSAGSPLRSTWSLGKIPGMGARIDHHLVSKHWRIASSEVGPSSGSDHKMLVTDLILE
jgi:endonuclease/exonuclease/phosphatase (EEP) superfamily protein YafD